MIPARGALAAALAAVAVAAPAQARTPRSFFGVMVDGPAIAANGSIAAQAGAIHRSGTTQIRVAFYWSDLEPERGAPRLATTDRLVLDAAVQGITVLPVVLRTPSWAAVDPKDVASRPKDVGDYARFLRALVARYGPSGTLWREHPGVRAVPIRRWQIWNEPDQAKYWQARQWAPSYVRLLQAAHTALRAADRGAVVVSAGLTNYSWKDLATLYRAGARRWFDVAAIHPFSRRVENVVKIVGLARQAMRDAGDARKPLLLTEVSWSSGAGRSTNNYGWEVSEAGQAEKVREVAQALAAQRTKLRIAGFYWYTWLSRKRGGADSFDYAGLRRIAGAGVADKPALAAWTQSIASLVR